MATRTRQRLYVEVTKDVKEELIKRRAHRRVTYNDALMRLLGLGGKEAEVSGASASSNSEGSS